MFLKGLAIPPINGVVCQFTAGLQIKFCKKMAIWRSRKMLSTSCVGKQHVIVGIFRGVRKTKLEFGLLKDRSVRSQIFRPCPLNKSFLSISIATKFKRPRVICRKDICKHPYPILPTVRSNRQRPADFVLRRRPQRTLWIFYGQPWHATKTESHFQCRRPGIQPADGRG